MAVGCSRNNSSATNEWKLKEFMPFDMFDLPKSRLKDKAKE